MLADRRVTVLLEGDRTEEWSLTTETLARTGYRLTLTASDGRMWSAEAGDIFETLMTLRMEAEQSNVLICCNGARRDAWASGMQRDMGTGAVCYRLEGVARGIRPPSAKTLDPAPPNLVVTVEEQRSWHHAWLLH